MEINRFITTMSLILFSSLASLPFSYVYARTVESISIEEIGRSSTKKDEKACAFFKPTLAQLRHYFNKAVPVPDRVVTTIRYSPCYATGKLKLSDGYEAKWYLSSGGGGSLEWLIEGHVYLLYKKNNWTDPYKGMYDDELDDDGNAK